MKNLLCCSRNNGSNIHINMYANFGNLELKLTQVNTIKYDVKSYQFMTTMVKCTDVRLKIFKELTTYRRYVDTVNEYVLGQLECRQGPYAFDSGLSLTSFQLHRIETGDA